jgi:glucosamine--fructose-6-phosphate aminotransferase (isomerizing)
MCGIAGIAGFDNVVDRLYAAIRALEYRGYDSCGIAVQTPDEIVLRKGVGGVEEVAQRERFLDLRGQVGIAHTRWATHGGVSRQNAHPHLSCGGEFAVVHNGIIDNYRELRDRLQSEGHRFHSETDTEVVAHLLEKHHAQGQDPIAAFLRSLSELQGSYALAVVSRHLPGRILCAKQRSPLILGLGEDGNYVGSDFNAFIDRTKRAVILDDGEMAVVSADDYYVIDRLRGEVVSKKVTTITWDAEMARRGGFPHFMLKEIHEQPDSVRKALQAEDEKIDAIAGLLARARQIYLVGVGTTHYVAQVGQYLFSDLAGRYPAVVSSDEFRNLARPEPGDVVLAISQSGETYDTLDAVRYAQERGVSTAAVVNVVGSSLERGVELAVLQMSGPEISVISTKAALAQMVVLARIAARLGERLHPEEPASARALLEELSALPGQIERLLNQQSGLLNQLARRHCQTNHWVFLGRGIYAPVAYECALKMKEVAYIHAEGMAAGFLKHGTLALIDDQVRSLFFLPPRSDTRLFELSQSSAHEIRARGGKIVALAFEAVEGLYDDAVLLPAVPPRCAPFLELVAGQLFSYFTALALGRSIDKPRSLAKSVTVP